MMKALKHTMVFVFILAGGIVFGQDTMYVHLKNGEIKKHPVDDVDSMTISYPSVTDVDGNTYKTVEIGGITWMAEDLRTVKFNDGSPITLVPHDGSSGTWSNLETEAYCPENVDSSTYGPSNGKLYNWYAVNTGKLCPIGWHVSTEEDWNALISYVRSVQGVEWQEAIPLKSSTGWNGTDSYGFNALPSDPTSSDRSFAAWWTPTNTDSFSAHAFFMSTSLHYVDFFGFNYKHRAMSIRCVKDY